MQRGCTVDGAGGVSSARRVARYTLRAGQLAALHAEELLLLGPAALGLKARSWHTLTRDAAPAPAPAPAASLQDALHKLPPALRDLSLELRPPPEDAADDDEVGVAHGQISGVGGSHYLRRSLPRVAAWEAGGRYLGVSDTARYFYYSSVDFSYDA